jgi:hypothetical protein
MNKAEQIISQIDGLFEKYASDLTEKERSDILWSFTCFPFGEHETYIFQLKKFLTNSAEYLAEMEKCHVPNI